MAKKLKKMDKQQAWQHIIKPIMVVLLWLLAVGALVAIICGGVRSCSNKQSAARQSDTAENIGITTTPLRQKRDVVKENEYLSMRSDTQVVFGEDEFRYIDDIYGIDYWYYGSSPADIPVIYKVDNLEGISLLYNGEYVNVVSITSRFIGKSGAGEYVGNQYKMPIEFQWAALVLENGLNYDFIKLLSSAGEGLTNMAIVHNSGGVSLNILKGSKDGQFCWALHYCYGQVSSQGFVFNNQINYNAPLNATLGQPYVSYSGTGIVAVEYNLDFISAGQVFNKIRVEYIRGGGTYDIEGVPTYVDDQSIVHFASLLYQNTYIGSSILVNGRNSKPYNVNNGTSMYLLNSSYWASSLFQNIEIIGSIDNNVLIDLTKFNNNSIPLDNGIIGSSSNIFDLLGSAFGSVASILAMSVLPGISLGLLVFIPVVMVIILALFKLLRK